MNWKKLFWLGTIAITVEGIAAAQPDPAAFRDPPEAARPGVYWYFMDGNLTREGMTADLESMKDAGLGHVVFLEVNVGVPRGPVDFLSEPWQELFVHAVREAERLGIEITLGSGPGWAGSGGPWVKPEQSMQHLAASSVEVHGPVRFDDILPIPEPRKPYFNGAVSGALIEQRQSFYKDVAVLAFPTPAGKERIADVDEKALYYRAPYTSVAGVKPYLPAPADHLGVPSESTIEPAKIVDLTGRLQSDGRLRWDVPAGDWTLMRFGARNNGATTRPAPDPGFGFECDKFDSAAFDAHLDAYVGKLLEKAAPRKKDRGWTMLHIDSWEMGAQNWTGRFREEFRRRRQYDPLPFFPAYTGRIVGSLEMSERFLWDLRLTAQELVIENHAGRLKELGRRYGLGLSIEPYDMNPTADLELGGVADVPMCEFWSEGFGFDSSFSCFEATSIAHTLGRPVVAAEAFTAGHDEAWKLYPGAVKNQGDWAFCVGINRLTYHTFAHKPYGRRPGMTMGPYGVHWDRGQTWWPMASAYHRYITRCQYLLRQGHAVADICYLTPEGAPHVFRPPSSAIEGNGSMRDRRGYNFDGCAPGALLAGASVREGCVVFPGGASYRLLVLPEFDTMTPRLLAKVRDLVKAGATVVGPPPRKSPSLTNYPQCDEQVASLAAQLWGQNNASGNVVERKFGRGRILSEGDLRVKAADEARPRPIEQAKWIWYPEGDPAAAVEPCQRFFRRVFEVDAGKRLRSAQLEITADNAFEVQVNEKQFSGGSNFHTIYTIDAKSAVKPGENVLAVTAINAGEAANPAGLIAALHVAYADGSELTISTDEQWLAGRQPGDESKSWVAAKPLGPFGMNPWRLQADAAAEFPELYPEYEATARVLAAMGVREDFRSDGSIRYTHRRGRGWDLYFVANRQARVVETDCTFRVTGCRPELWEPLTGIIRSLPQFTEQAGCTVVPIRFEAHQSFFVMFAELEKPLPAVAAGSNFATPRMIGEIDGPWEVSFDPSLGGPAQMTFATLEDWTHRPEAGVKHYSGIATYRKTFDLPKAGQAPGRSVLLDLGTVHNVARVRLNGRDLGVVWCAPWSVNITDVVRANDNRLEIDVANLWVNRLIGDKGLPAEQRVAWTTHNPYQADARLSPSGLLGPVTFLATREP